MIQSYLLTKLFVPTLRKGFVSRPRLISMLDKAVEENQRLVVLCAPAGYGKTTLLSEWVHQKKDQSCISWYSIDEDDNDPARFFFYIMVAIGDKNQGDEFHHQEFLLLPHISAFKIMVDNILNQIAQSDTPRILVFDDYHLIHDQEIHSTISYMLDHLPPKIQIVLSMRSEPPLSIAKLAARAQVTEIRGDDLRFTTEETIKFLHQTMNIRLSPEDEKLIDQHSDGWIAALQLAAASWLSNRDKQTILEGISGRSNYVFEYLVSEILDPLDDETKKFLFSTSILDRFCEPLCQVMTGNKNCKEMLEKIEKANLFINSLDEKGIWFRYHHLFAETLRQESGKIFSLKQREELYQRAAAWFASQSLYIEAMEYTIQGNDETQILDILEIASREVLFRSEFHTLINWVNGLPRSFIIHRPRIVILYAWALFLAGRYQEIEEYLQIAREMADPIVTDQNRDVAGYIYSLELMLGFFTGKIGDIRTWEKKLKEYASTKDELLNGFILWFLGMCYFIDGGYAESKEVFLDIIKREQKVNNTLNTWVSIYALGNIYLFRGDYKKAYEIFKQDNYYLENNPIIMGKPADNFFCIGLGEVLREWNQVNEAIVYIERGIKYGKNWGNAEFFIDGYISLARIKEALGDIDGGLEILAEAEDFVTEKKVSGITDIQIDACRARLWVKQGNFTEAEKWAARRSDILSHIEDGKFWRTLYGMEEQIRIRLLIAQRKYDKAESRLIDLGTMFADEKPSKMCIDIEILMAVVCRKTGRDDLAFSHLLKAVQDAESGYLQRIFLDEAEAVGLLKQYFPQLYNTSDRIEWQVYLNTLSAGVDAEIKKQLAVVEDKALLSPREMDVLHMIVSGRTNQQMAEELFIAESTVKTHIKHIYEKLGAKNRAQAIFQARTMGLL